MVNILRLAPHRLLLGVVATVDTLPVLPKSPATSAGFQQKLVLLLFNKHSNGGTKSEAQKHSLIFLNQNYEVTTNSEERKKREDKVACNNFVIQ